MIYFCADDYGMNDTVSKHIKECVDKGAINTVSVFPNFDEVDLDGLVKNSDLRISLHLNLVEGKCMANPKEVSLIADENGNIKHTFMGLLKLSLLRRKEFERQIEKEIRAQVVYWKERLPEGRGFCIDSHQHTHMIPAIFKALLKVLKAENIEVRHIRVPAEQLLPFIKAPSLYFTYSAVNLIKQWLLKFLWQINKPLAKKHKLPTALFLGILFSGYMDEQRITKILPRYERLAQKRGCDIEVLFHPGYIDSTVADFGAKNVVFEHFYLSKNRKTEFDSVMRINQTEKALKKEACKNALH